MRPSEARQSRVASPKIRSNFEQSSAELAGRAAGVNEIVVLMIESPEDAAEASFFAADQVNDSFARLRLITRPAPWEAEELDLHSHDDASLAPRDVIDLP